jgi:hypothetical protein
MVIERDMSTHTHTQLPSLPYLPSHLPRQCCAAQESFEAVRQQYGVTVPQIRTALEAWLGCCRDQFGISDIATLQQQLTAAAGGGGGDMERAGEETAKEASPWSGFLGLKERMGISHLPSSLTLPAPLLFHICTPSSPPFSSST